MAKSHSKLRALALRREGRSLSEIAKEVGVSKSTVGNWCKDLVLTKAQREHLWKKQVAAGNVGRLRGGEVNRKRKEEKVTRALAEGKKKLLKLSENEFFVAGLAVYWGEGSKSDNLSFINSDPKMLLFMIQWFRYFFDVQKEDLMPRIFINEVHKSRINAVSGYWVKTLGIPRSQFRAPTFNKSVPKKLYENHSKHYGLVSLRIRRSTDMKYRIWGLIEGLKSSNLPIPADVAQLVRASHS